MAVKHVFHAPVEGPGGFITEVSFRSPLFEEFCAHGSPFVDIPMETGPFEQIDRALLLDWAIRLADGSSGGQYAVRKAHDPRDFDAITRIIRNFFRPASGEPTASSPSTPAEPMPISIG